MEVPWIQKPLVGYLAIYKCPGISLNEYISLHRPYLISYLALHHPVLHPYIVPLAWGPGELLLAVVLAVYLFLPVNSGMRETIVSGYFCPRVYA